MKTLGSSTVRILLAVLALGALTLAQRTPETPGEIARAVAEGRARADEILIKFRPGTTAAEESDARAWVNAQRRELLRANAAGETELADVRPGMALENVVALLNQNPAVEYAEPNWIYTHQATANDPYFVNGSLWGMYGSQTTPANQWGSNAAAAWAAGFTGSSNVIVGVIDEGIDYHHPDLAANIWTNPFEIPGNGIDDDHNGYVDDVHGWDFVHNDNSIYDGTPSALDVDAHGTHVSGTIGGVGNNGVGVAGVNWHVQIISGKFLGPGGGTTANAIKAVDYLTDLKTRHNLNIVATNNSWGGGGYSQGLHDAIIRAANAGILFIAAAGNSNLNNDANNSYPSNYNTAIGTSTQAAASYDSVIAVAAVCGTVNSYCSAAGNRASFSSFGATTVDLGAPGVGIISTTPQNTYSSYSGTSMATPHVTGAAALYASKNPGATAAQVKAAILSSATQTPTPSLAGKTVTGGRLNIGILLGGGPPPPPPAPGAPTNLSGSASGATVSLTWTAASNATSYKVLRSTTTGGPYTQLASGVTALNYVDTVPASGTYFYVTQGVNTTGTGPNSNEASVAVVIPPPPPLPGAPTNLSAGASGATVTLTWGAASNATSYKVLRSTTSGGPYTQVASGVTALTYADTLAASGTYFYITQGVNNVGTGPNSNQASVAVVVPPPSGPPAPTNLTVTPGVNQLTVSWTGSAGAIGYRVYRCATNCTSPTASFTRVISVTQTSWVNTGLTTGATFYYYVTALTSSGGVSGPSNIGFGTAQ